MKIIEFTLAPHNPSWLAVVDVVTLPPALNRALAEGARVQAFVLDGYENTEQLVVVIPGHSGKLTLPKVAIEDITEPVTSTIGASGWEILVAKLADGRRLHVRYSLDPSTAEAMLFSAESSQQMATAFAV
jgi:hypothetical protein